MTKVIRTGSFIPTNVDGYFINNYTVSKVQKKWMQAINFAQELIRKVLQQKVHSIYCRGSVIENRAKDKISDVDMLIICFKKITPNEQLKIKIELNKLNKKFLFVTRFDLIFIPLKDLSKKKSDFYHFQFVIKILSLQLYGKKLPIAPISFNYKNIPLSQLPFIDKKISIASLKILKSKTSAELKKWANWIFKSIIRAGFEKTIALEKQYTRDLYLCYKVFKKYYPAESNNMRLALYLTINPNNNKEQMLNLLNKFQSFFKNAK